MRIKDFKLNIIAMLIFSLAIFGFSFNFSFAAGGPLAPGVTCIDSSQCEFGNCVPLGNTKVCQNPTLQSGTIPIKFTSPTTVGTFKDFVCNITIFFSQTVVPPVAVLMTLVVGFLYLISQGDPRKVSEVNKTLVFTVIGVAVLLLAPAIVSLVADIFGGSFAQTSCSVQATTNIIKDTLIRIVNWMAWLMAITSVCAGLYAAFLYLTAAGRTDQIPKANKVLIFTIIGTIIAVISFSIIRLVESLTGFTFGTEAQIGGKNIVNLILAIVNWFVWIVGIAAVVMGLYSAMLFITGAGDDTKLKKAKDILIYSIIGIIVAILSFGIIKLVRNLTGF